MKYDIYINDTIGWPISADYVRSAIDSHGEGHIDVYISSLGGDVATALQIRQMFVEHGDVTVQLQGFVASAATVIATGAREVRMGKYALYMIHKCSSWQDEWGLMNADDIASVIARLAAEKKVLDQVDLVMASIYADRTGLSLDEIHTMMSAETWMDATEAFKHGFVDTITDDAPLQLTDALRGRIAACGYPVPQVQGETASPGFWSRMRQLLEDVFSIQPIYDTNLSDMKREEGNQESAAVQDVQPTAPAATPAAGENPDAQSASAEDADIQALRSAYEEIRDERDALQAQVAALQQADGDETAHIEGDGSVDGTDCSHIERARAAYTRIKGLLG